MTVEVRVAHIAPAGKSTRFEVRLRDDDASDYHVVIRYGDGGGMGMGRYAKCIWARKPR